MGGGPEASALPTRTVAATRTGCWATCPVVGPGTRSGLSTTSIRRFAPLGCISGYAVIRGGRRPPPRTEQRAGGTKSL